jgi:hypothetical protein
MRLLPSLPVLALSALTFAACVPLDSSIEVENRSSFEIHEIYVTPEHAGSWGDNLLASDEVVMPGDTTLLGLTHGRYDAMMVDELGGVCEVFGIDLDHDDASWIITNKSCVLFEARAAAAAQ